MIGILPVINESIMVLHVVALHLLSTESKASMHVDVLTAIAMHCSQCASNPVPIGVGYLCQYLIKPMLGFIIAKARVGRRPQRSLRAPSTICTALVAEPSIGFPAPACIRMAIRLSRTERYLSA